MPFRLSVVKKYWYYRFFCNMFNSIKCIQSMKKKWNFTLNTLGMMCFLTNCISQPAPFFLFLRTNFSKIENVLKKEICGHHSWHRQFVHHCDWFGKFAVLCWKFIIYVQTNYSLAIPFFLHTSSHENLLKWYVLEVNKLHTRHTAVNAF